jgi:hypothetical protein
MKTDLSCLGSNEKNVGEATGPRGPSERERASQTSQPQSVRDFNPITSTARPLASASVSEPLSSRPLGAPKRSEGDSTVNFPPDSHFQVFANQRLPACASQCGRGIPLLNQLSTFFPRNSFCPNHGRTQSHPIARGRSSRLQTFRPALRITPYQTKSKCIKVYQTGSMGLPRFWGLGSLRAG